MRRRRGTEPISARSAYGLRTILAVTAAIGGGIGASWFVFAAARPGGPGTGETVAALLCIAVALTALVDLAVIWRRTHTKDASGGA